MNSSDKSTDSGRAMGVIYDLKKCQLVENTKILILKITEVNLVITLVQNVQQKIVIGLNNFISVELI